MRLMNQFNTLKLSKNLLCFLIKFLRKLLKNILKQVIVCKLFLIVNNVYFFNLNLIVFKEIKLGVMEFKNIQGKHLLNK